MYKLHEKDILGVELLARQKLIATVERRGGVYNRTGEPIAAFCERKGAARVRSDFNKKIGASGIKLAPTWRRARDSNPRTVLGGYTISNRAPSTSSDNSPNVTIGIIADIRKKIKLFFVICKKKFPKFENSQKGLVFLHEV